VMSKPFVIVTYWCKTHDGLIYGDFVLDGVFYLCRIGRDRGATHV
jgi:hypothetical protein